MSPRITFYEYPMKATKAMVSFNSKPYLNLKNLEIGLAGHYKKSLRAQALTLDLSAVEWVSPLSLCILFSWAQDVLHAEGDVLLRPPINISYASRYFHTADILRSFKQVGVEIQPANLKSHSFKTDKIAAFEYFPNRPQADRYLDALSDHRRAQILLHAEDLPEIVTSGDLRRTVLRELLDNSFTHGTSEECHYATVETAPARHSRFEHPIYSPLDNRPYIEICVADNSQQNIVDTLKEFLRKDYKPKGTIEPRRSLSEIERCLFYAFEYESTSQPERRRQRLLRLLREQDEPVGSIATGLYDVASLTRFYGGQLIFRSNGHVGTLDFSRNRLTPRLAIRKRIDRKNLAPLRGTVILVRLPAELVGRERVIAPLLSIPTRHEKIDSLAIAVLPPVAYKPPKNEIGITLDLEKMLLDQSRKPLTREILLGEKRAELTALLLDGFDLSTKPFGALLMLLSRIPRHGQGLIVVVDDSVKVELAYEQWVRCQDLPQLQKEFLRYPSFALAADWSSAITAFGSTQHADAVVCGTGTPYIIYRQVEYSLAEVLAEVRRQRLASKILDPAILHSGKLFLVESAYYTPTFFEVRRLLDFLPDRRSFLYWLASQLFTLSPTAIVVGTEFLRAILNEIVETNVRDRETRIFELESANVVSLALGTTSQPQDKVVVLVDVLCTGRFLKRFLNMVPDPKRVTVIAIVDARGSNSDFIPVIRTAGTVDVPVISILRHPVQVIRDRPESFDIRDVLIIDRVTHAPTRYAYPERSNLDAEILLANANAAGALAAGHFLLKDRHYAYFFSFRPAFGSIREELSNWLREGAQELRTDVGVNINNVKVFCLDEDTGLLEILERSLAESPLPGPNAISKKQLFAPPIREATALDAAWFVLPAMESGTTVRRTLEYAKAIRANRAQLSIVAARVEGDRALFYQNVTKYGGMKVRIRFLCTLPLLAYSEGTCPVCALQKSFKGMLANIGHKRPALRAIVGERSRNLVPFPAKSAAYLGLDLPSVSYSGLWLEARAREEFESADRNPTARRRLMKNLENQEFSEALAAAVGREPGANVFSSERAAFIAYDPEIISRACLEWCTKPIHDPKLFERQLRGFAQLAPENLRREVGKLINRYKDERIFCEAILTEAARRSDLYWEAIEKANEPSDVNLARALYELQDYLRRGAAGEHAEPILALHELRWHLTRSTSWGMALEMLRMKLNLGEEQKVVSAAYDRFIHDGFNEAERRFHIFRNTGSLWQRIINKITDLETCWKLVAERVRDLESFVSSSSLDYNEITRAISEIESATSEFVQGIDKLAIRPGSEMHEVQRLASASELTKVDFEISVDSECPAVAMWREDFHEIMLLLLENAKLWARDLESQNTVFSFRPVPNAPFVSLELTQASICRFEGGLQGGLARVRELLSHYGSMLFLEREAPSGSPFLIIRFFSWPFQSHERERHETWTDSGK